jgi:hypothetical protein
MNKLFWFGLGGGIFITSCSHSQSPISKMPPVLPVNPQVMAVRSVPRQIAVPAVKPPPTLPMPMLIPPVGSATAGGVGDRPDPFSALPLNPVVVIKPGTPLPNTAPVSPSAPADAPVAAAQQPAPLPSVTVAAVPPPTLPAPVIPPSPSVAPTPPIAETIAVSGVVQAGSRTSIIVQVPHESSTRYAVVGDYLANGRVLVKRIETQGSEPMVVLEQNGVEFIKSVGSGAGIF